MTIAKRILKINKVFERVHLPNKFIIKGPSQGLMSIASYLKSKDIEISVLDATIHYIDVDKIKEDSFNDFKKTKRHVKEFTTYTQEFPQEELEKYFAKNNFDVFIIDCHYAGTINIALKHLN